MQKAYEPSVSVPSGFIFFKLLFYSLLFKYFVFTFCEAFLQSFLHKRKASYEFYVFLRLNFSSRDFFHNFLLRFMVFVA